MTEKTLIGVDIGTQGTRAAIFSLAGRTLAVVTRKSRLHQPSRGITEEDPGRQLASVCQSIKACMESSRINPAGVQAVGIDGQMAGIIGVGPDGKNVTPYDSWLDTRCGPYIEKMLRTAGDEVLRKAGCAPSFNHGPKILWWMHEQKRTFRSIRKFVQPAGYAAMRLCGLGAKDAFIDKTYLHFSGFGDNRRNRWDPHLCKLFNLDAEKLPRIVDPHEIVGQLCPSMAKRCGLRSGVPIAAGCGDTAASFLSCGATEEGVCVDVAGTASVFACTTSTFRSDLKNRILGCGQAATPGLWHPYAYINGGGMNVEWFLRELANNGSKIESGTWNLRRLNTLGAKIPPSDSHPLFVPHMQGRVCPGQPHLRGSWVNLSWKHTLGHLYRALLEGVALEYGIYRKAVVKLYPHLDLKEVRITGGGEKSQLWNQLKATVLNIPVVQIAKGEGAPMGSAMLAGFGVGLFKSLPAVAKAWVRKGYRYKPERKLVALYQKRIRDYELLLRVLNEFGESIQGCGV